MTNIARSPCRTFCPSPPVSSAQLRAPYSPPWLSTLTNNPFGRLIVAYGGSLYTFQSKCNGPVWYDAATGAVSVQNPPYASSIPKETDYGYLTLTVPSSETICQDGSDSCTSEVRQQFASQRVNETDCGDILLWNTPACGQVPPLQASDAQNQGRFDRATLELLDDIDSTCSATGDVTLFGFYPKPITVAGVGQTTCRQPVRMRRLRFKADQWGTFSSTDAAADKAMVMIAKNVGGTTDNPCMELEMTDITLAQLHTATLPPVGWNWAPTQPITIYNGVPSGLNTFASTFNLGVAPSTAKSLKIFIETEVQSSTGDNIDFDLVCNGVIIVQGGVDDTSSSFQQPLGVQADVPATLGGNVNFAGGAGGPAGGTRNIIVKVRLLAWQ